MSPPHPPPPFARSHRYTEQLFGGGIHEPAHLLAGFEDWRKGTRGMRQGEAPGSFDPSGGAPPGAHFDPFAFTSLGPNIPSYNYTTNNGLVLNSASLDLQIAQQNHWIDQIEDTIQFTVDNLDIGVMDASKRARIDVRKLMSLTRDEHNNLLAFEKDKLDTLENSQCVNEPCELLFNTSSLTMTGAIDVVGTYVRERKEATHCVSVLTLSPADP